MSYSDYLVQWRTPGQGGSPAVNTRQLWRRETRTYRTITDRRSAFGDKVRDCAELVVVAVYLAAVFAEMVMLFGPAIH